MFKATLIAFLLFLPGLSHAVDGIVIEKAGGYFCIPNSTLSTAYGEFTGADPTELVGKYKLTYARSGVNICRGYAYLDTAIDMSTIDELNFDYELTVNSGQCSFGWWRFTNGAYGCGNFSASDSGTCTLTTTASAFDTDDLGVYMSGVSGQLADCDLTITDIYDQNDVTLWHTYDTESSGGATTTEYATTTVYDWLPTNVVVTSTLCTEETSTTTGMATTTCTNTLSTTTAGTYQLDTTEPTNVLKTAFLYFVWLSSFGLVLTVLLLFMRGRYGHY